MWRLLSDFVAAKNRCSRFATLDDNKLSTEESRSNDFHVILIPPTCQEIKKESLASRQILGASQTGVTRPTNRFAQSIDCKSSVNAKMYLLISKEEKKEPLSGINKQTSLMASKSYKARAWLKTIGK
jgi:hypothetical protein